MFLGTELSVPPIPIIEDAVLSTGNKEPAPCAGYVVQHVQSEFVELSPFLHNPFTNHLCPHNFLSFGITVFTAGNDLLSHFPESFRNEYVPKVVAYAPPSYI